MPGIFFKDENAPWPHSSVTFLGQPHNFGLSTKDWRYLHYPNGDEELYQIKNDPHEWHNLATKKEHQGKLQELRALAPQKFAPLKKSSIAALIALKWQPATSGKTPPSKPDGNPFEVFFINNAGNPVELFAMTSDGDRKSQGLIPPGKTKSQKTRPGDVWQIATPKTQKPLGHFTVTDRRAKAIIPQ